MFYAIVRPRRVRDFLAESRYLLLPLAAESRRLLVILSVISTLALDKAASISALPILFLLFSNGS